MSEEVLELHGGRGGSRSLPPLAGPSESPCFVVGATFTSWVCFFLFSSHPETNRRACSFEIEGTFGGGKQTKKKMEEVKRSKGKRNWGPEKQERTVCPIGRLVGWRWFMPSYRFSSLPCNCLAPPTQMTRV